MQKVVMTGVTGFIGRSLRQRFLLANIEVNEISYRSIKSLIENGAKQAQVDKYLFEKMCGASSLIHCGGIAKNMAFVTRSVQQKFTKANVDYTEKLAVIAKQAGVNQFVFLSSALVCGDHSSIGSPFTSSSAYDPRGCYARSKAEAEQVLRKVLRAGSLEPLIFRLPPVYGVGVKGGIRTIRRMIGWGCPLPFKDIVSPRSFLASQNLEDAIMSGIANGVHFEKALYLSDGDDLSISAFAGLIANSMGKNLRLFSLQKRCFVGRVSKYLFPFQVDISETKALLNWQPNYSTARAIEEMIRNGNS